MSTSANFASTPVSGSARISTANTARDGTGAIAIVYTAPAGGARIDDVTIAAIGNTTAGMIRMYLHDGTAYRLFRELNVSVVTPSGTVPAFIAQLSNLGLVLPSAWSLRVSTHNAESFDVTVTAAGGF